MISRIVSLPYYRKFVFFAGYTEFSFTTKRCEYQCEEGTQLNGMTTTCCDIDLCNAAGIGL